MSGKHQTNDCTEAAIIFSFPDARGRPYRHVRPARFFFLLLPLRLHPDIRWAFRRMDEQEEED